MIIAFSGHRPDKLPDKATGYKLPNPTYIYVCQQLEKTLKELQPTEAISGFALGVDSWAANICIKLGIPLTAAIPFLGQEKAWPLKSQQTYHKLLSKAAKQVIVCEGSYAAAKMQIRNQWMCDHCDLLIGVWDGSSGGTANCITYAKSIGREIIIINPKEKQ